VVERVRRAREEESALTSARTSLRRLSTARSSEVSLPPPSESRPSSCGAPSPKQPEGGEAHGLAEASCASCSLSSAALAAQTRLAATPAGGGATPE